MKKLRNAREYVAQNFNSEYPFVDYRFKTEGYHLLLNFSQFEPDDNMNRLVVADSSGQLGWQEVIADKFAEFDYEELDGENLALKWHPAGRQSRVVIDPRVSFGAPTIDGIPTWVLKGRWTAGESLQDIVEDFSISEAHIRDGLDFEGLELAA